MTKKNRSLKPHIPYAHVLHKENKNCGCYVGRGTPIVCSHCGATYERETIITFPVWECYDCGMRWWTSVNRANEKEFVDWLMRKEVQGNE